MTRAIIFANGNLSDLSHAKKIINKEDCLIAADGAVKHILKLKLIPKIIIGDLDSTPLSLQKELKVQFIKYPRKKDKTDFELAVDYCLENKFQEIIIFGVLGDRIDHLMANIFLLAKIQTENPTIKIKVIEGKKEIFILNKEIVINGKIGDEISIIPVGEKLEDILTDGLEYQLDNESLLFGSTRGISNVMNKKLVKIKASAGIAMIEHNLQ
ncbi:thiamine diphosphokinase [Candidatus Roizmanbacteria bacterium CG_4_8_14_3_um_filter_34_9]|uniref:Thiamine diphosphokinase n=3 Tax=Candidatus Roizmaniibacteriota TaxID=1752723 RepID=A0A2M7AVL4_9BACT|nr:MAG: thiamine diphosphokinase [Candidatus Roizmanbacteria bacterium CG07_land_8_20_14_0_80_34_15]PIU74661.1 MAG: thiamine diphosphokinase [Candidatus Roizmanbacteria bacterium CG06_land_8_20_14_3_00_34_14]PIW73298.1 MAG: thiamine diphosphokinase [Candidatus Roizmanbacteria bacterium CG_4_8_14_3_um_filter_34_9]